MKLLILLGVIFNRYSENIANYLIFNKFAK